MPTRRTILSGLAFTTGAALTHSLGAMTPSSAQLLRDPLRPAYHLLPESGWMNDPCGPIYWKGRYHMFYQYNAEPVSSVKLWAHAVSSDMVHWQRLPVALAPTPGGPDADGCWTGTAAVLNGKVAFLYTGSVNSTPEQATLRDGTTSLRESVCMAVAEDDNLMHWRKVSQPVIASPPAGMAITGFRDPSPWRQGNQWYLVLASGQRGVGGMVLLYQSTDLEHWKYLHPMAQGRWSGKPAANPVDSGEMWECPDFFPLEGKHVLIHSTEGKTLWQSGTLDTATMLFHAEKQGLLDHGSYYAPKSQLDAKGNRILWGWIPDARPPAEYSAAGWSGMMSLPRRLTLEDGELVMQPAEQVASLRTQPRTGATAARLPSGAQELRLTLEPAQAKTPLEQSFTDQQGAALLLRADTQQSLGSVRVGAYEISGTQGPLDLHIFFDHSVAEIFINHRHAVTQRYYKRTTLEPAVAITLGGNWKLTQQLGWTLEGIWS